MGIDKITDLNSERWIHSTVFQGRGMYGAQEGERQLVSLLVLHTRLLCGPLPKDPCTSVALLSDPTR